MSIAHVVFEPKQMSAAELEEGHLWLMAETYNDEQLKRRKRHYVDIMKKLI